MIFTLHSNLNVLLKDFVRTTKFFIFCVLTFVFNLGFWIGPQYDVLCHFTGYLYMFVAAIN